MTTYELRDGRFTVNGEWIPVSPLIIKAALISHRIETGVELSEDYAALPEEVARRILRMERKRSIAAVVEAIKSSTAA